VLPNRCKYDVGAEGLPEMRLHGWVGQSARCPGAPCDDDDRGMFLVEHVQAFQKLETVHLWHHQIEDDQRGLEPVKQQLKGVVAIPGGDHFEFRCLRADEVYQGHPGVFIVLDHQNASSVATIHHGFECWSRPHKDRVPLVAIVTANVKVCDGFRHSAVKTVLPKPFAVEAFLPTATPRLQVSGRRWGAVDSCAERPHGDWPEDRE